jgi:cell wall assembly regulator SMI1
MNAIRQIVEVKDHKLNIELPENFDSEYAEVIIFAKDESFDFEISEKEKALMKKRLAESKEEDFEDWDSIKHNFL